MNRHDLKKKSGLSPAQHLELGLALKEARRLLLEAAAQSRYYRNISRELFEIADSLMSPRAELERRLIALVGEEDWVRDCYFGELASEEVEEVDG